MEGCCHGELDKIYDVIGQLEEREGVTVDLLICCGDFQVLLSDRNVRMIKDQVFPPISQAVRDKTDLNSMAVPPKYREMGSFYKARVFFNTPAKKCNHAR